ncbi:unnamed protein product [Diatraea saccharalis]|uniref:Ig-like domain-containing protein n=1 Tax=Diatraea saccharalis TaxID=40085 RepID=A0A9N9N3B9_9NEOP|nr:unnamed protein product [Diatraea saccharalis]
MEPPTFESRPLTTVRAAPGTDACLHIPAPAGTPPFHYRWSRAGASLDDRFTTSDEVGGVRLTVAAARTGDSGVYTLQASNAGGRDSARVRLEVSAEEAPTGEDPPTFLRRLQDLTVKVGARTRFLVEIVSSTECRVTWYRNERRLLEAERVSLVRDGNFWCAELAAVSVDDAGRWTCTAENNGGRASCSAHLNVLVPKAYKRPEFVEELRALLTEQGTVSLECKVVGVPTPVLRWFKDSREIKAGDVFALTASTEDPTSLGTYTCEAVNCMGRAYSSSKVHVLGRAASDAPATSASTLDPPPIFTKELEDQFVRICEPLTLSCTVMVPPWPRSVVWYNKEGKLEPGERYHLVEDGVGGYLLEVVSAEWPDEGEWKCVATSSGGRVGISTCYVTMDVPKNYRKPRFMENLQAVLTEEGLVSFECKVVGFPTPVLNWFKDGQELKPGDVYQLTGTNSLGSYCCIARNCMGHASSSAELTVEDIQNQLNEEEKLQLFSKNQAPKFIQGLKSVEAKIDESFRFTVKVAIPPEPSVLWYRDDQPVDESTRCHLVKEDRGVFNLDIQALELLDQAEWKCVAMNDFGHSVTSCFLKLIIPRHYKKPRFLENLQAILSDEGAVNLECKVIGVPQPVLKWYKDGEELKPGDIHRIISGQDGTCCLGTYTCEAQNCMGIAASSASLLGFDDTIKSKSKKKAEEQALQRNLSLSTIHEERTSQMYDTPVGDITLDDKGEISFSFDGKEVSVSLYETPDLTEEEALQIVEMYADQLSENVTEHNVVELPPLRFVKETSTSGNLLMEAIIIDVSPEYFASPEEDLRTEADVEDFSIAEENAAPQLSLDQDVSGEDYLEKTMALLSDEKSDVPKKMLRKKSDSQRSADDFYSLSRDQSLSEEKRDDDTQIMSESDLQSFASARSLDKPKSKSSKPSLGDGQESSDFTKTILNKEEVNKMTEQETPVLKPRRDRRSSRSSRRSSSGSEKSYTKSGEEPKPLKTPVNLETQSKRMIMSDEDFREKINVISVSISKIINDVQIIERDIILKSELMSSAATASRSLEIISSLIKPLSEIQSIADVIKETALESKEVSNSLFNNLPQSLKSLYQSLTIVEKCIDVESDNKTLVKKTCVAFIETCGEEMKNWMNEIVSITEKDYIVAETKTISEINSLVNEMNTVVRFSADTIKAKNLLTEASEIKTEEHSLETKHLRDTQKAIFELKSPLKSLLCIVDAADSTDLKDVCRLKSSEVILNDMSASIQDLQVALENIESLSVKESTSTVCKYNTEIIETVMESALKLRSSFEQLSIETKQEEDKELLKQILVSIKNNLSEISSQIQTIENKVGSFDILQSDNKLEVLQKMAQILISLENSIPQLDAIPNIRSHMGIFHKNLTKVLENVIESNEVTKYFIFMEICEAVHRLNNSILNISSDNILYLSSISNTLEIIQDTFVRHIFESELNCAILTNITDVLLSVQEVLNRADEVSLQLDSEHTQNIPSIAYDISAANVIIEHIDQTIAIIKTVKAIESTKEIEKSVTPIFENICPILEDLKRNIASVRSTDIIADERISELSVSSFVKSLATPLLELNQNILTLNQYIVENLESFKENNEFVSAIAEPLQELYTTLQIIQQDVISQYGENVAPYEVSINMISAVQNLQSCIVLIEEQNAVEGIDEMSTLEDVSGIKTTAETIPSERLVLAAAEEIGIHQSVEPFDQEIAQSVIAQTLQTLNQHIAVLQNPEVLDALDTLSEVSDYCSLKSVALGLGELHSGLEELLHPLIIESSDEIANLVNTNKLIAIAEPMQELHHSLSVLDTNNIPVYEHILEIPTEKINIVLNTIFEFKESLNECIKLIFPAIETTDKTVEISNKVEALRGICEHFKVVLQASKTVPQGVPVVQELQILEETVDNLLNATDVSKGIQIDEVKTVTEQLYGKILTIQDDLIQYTPFTSERLVDEAKLIKSINEIENNIAVLEEYEFVDLSRVSHLTSCITPQNATEIEMDSLIQMDNILQSAVNVAHDSLQFTPVADLMILEDFFTTCKNEFTILRHLITKSLNHKKTIRLIEEFGFIQKLVKDFEGKRCDLQFTEDINNYLTTFFIQVNENLETVQKQVLKVLDCQSELLFKKPRDEIERASLLLKDILSKNVVKSVVLEQVIVKFLEIIDIVDPKLKNLQESITKEIKYSVRECPDEENRLFEKMADILNVVEVNSLSVSLDDLNKNILLKILKCLQKHQIYKDASGSVKYLIISKCLSECGNILQNITPHTKNPEPVVEMKIEHNTLKAILSEMLVPLQALRGQVMSIQEKVCSNAEEDSVSVDIATTESIMETMSDKHKQFLEQIESPDTVINNESFSLIMEADKEIHVIHESLKLIDNAPVVEELKEITKSVEELEKSLHNVLVKEFNEEEIIEKCSKGRFYLRQFL